MSLPEHHARRRELQQLAGGGAHAGRLAPGEHPRRLDDHQQHAPDGALHAGQLEGRDRNQWGDDPFPVVRSIWNQPGKSLVAQLNQNIGSTMVNSLTFSYSANTIDGHARRRGPGAGRRRSTRRSPPSSRPTSSSRAAQAQPAALWGVARALLGRHLWNQAPWLNNQDLFVLKDDYSAVFGKHFVKAGVLAQLQQEERGARQHLAGVGAVSTARSGFLGPNGVRRPGVTTGNTIGELAAARASVWNTGEIRTNKPVQQRWNDFEFYIADSYKVSPRVTADFGVRSQPPHACPTMADDQHGELRPGRRSTPPRQLPLQRPALPPGRRTPAPPSAWPGGADGPNRSLQPDQGACCSRRASASPGTSTATARRPCAAAWASSTAASG